VLVTINIMEIQLRSVDDMISIVMGLCRLLCAMLCGEKYSLTTSESRAGFWMWSGI